MSAIAKSQSLVRSLKDRLSKRMPAGYIVRDSVDAAGARLEIQQDSSWSSTEQKAVIRIVAQGTQFSDIVGGAQKVYTPMVAQMISEGDSATPIASQLTASNQARILNELFRLGIKVELYLTDLAVEPALSLFLADGTVNTSSTCVLIDRIEPDLQWPLSGQ
jgi:hypothetical protein